MTQKQIVCLFVLTISFLFSSSLYARQGYEKDSVIEDAAKFFGKGTEGIAEVVEKIFKEQGRPNAIIKGEEASGALGVGARYGDGILKFKSGGSNKVH